MAPPTSEPYLQGIDLYNRGHFWQAHEAWEELWKSAPPSPERALLQALIQLAAAALQASRGKDAGARRLLSRAPRR